MKKNLYCISLVTFIVGCNSPSKDKVIVEKDSKGIVITSFQGDNIESIISYKLDSITKEGAAFYYANGTIDKSLYWNDGNIVGGSIEYQKGIPNLYICRDSYGDTIFFRKFNGRRIEFDSGQLLPHGHVDLDDLEKDSSVAVTIFAANPPYTSVQIKDYIVDALSRDTIFPIYSSIKYDWVHRHIFKLPRRSVYYYERITKIADTIGNPGKIIVKTDTLGFKWFS